MTDVLCVSTCILSSSSIIHPSTITLLCVVSPSVLCYCIAMLIESSVHPYDVLEAEPEVVSGYYVDYGAVVFMLVYLGEGIVLVPKQ